MTARTCGPCALCCKLPALAVLEKPAGAWCRLVAAPPSGGCTSYATRPAPCRAYVCGWLAGLGPEELRPDRSRVIVQGATLEQAAGPSRLTLLVDPTYPGAWHRGAAGRLVSAALARGEDVLTLTGTQPPRLHRRHAATGQVETIQLQSAPAEGIA